MEFTRTVEFTAAYDKRDPDPARNYGVHGVNIRFLLKGPEGVAQFLLYTNWMLPHVQEEFDSKLLNQFPYMFHKPLPTDLGCHSPKPRHEGDTAITESCSYLDGKPCYYDGSGMAAKRVYKRLLREGDTGVWDELEKYYMGIFGLKEG